MKKEKIILENLEAAKEVLHSMDINPNVAWNNSTKTKGVRQLHVAVRKSTFNMSLLTDSVQTRKLTDHWYDDAFWVNVYFYARKYGRK